MNRFYLPAQPKGHQSTNTQGAPLPPSSPDTVVTFQAWHEFDSSTQQWVQVDPTSTSRAPEATHPCDPNNLVLATWNIDAFSASGTARASGIISHVLSFATAPDIIFLQEVSREGLTSVLADPRIRKSYFSTEAGWANWERVTSFATMTLLSRSRFGYGENIAGTPTLGPVWRVKFPSRYLRDALCCDIFIPSATATGNVADLAATTTPDAPTAPDTPAALDETTTPAATSDSTPPTTTSRTRLINVHLDSLAIRPCFRPRQLAITASFLRAAGRGLVAGDFNPVWPEDDSLVGENGLEDAWVALRADEPGYTWGIDGKQKFPPRRLDKIAMLGLKATDIEVMDAGPVDRAAAKQITEVGSTSSGGPATTSKSALLWSDHSGLRCSFGLPKAGDQQTAYEPIRSMKGYTRFVTSILRRLR